MDQETPEVPSNWYEDLFNGMFVDMWMQAVPEEHTRAETDFIRRMIGVSPPAELLDVPCGGGRHSLPLAAAGYRMTSVDNSEKFLAAGRSLAAQQAGSITWIKSHMRDIEWRSQFEGAFCAGNSFGYLDDKGNSDFLRAIFRALKPNARFVLDASMCLEARLPTFQEKNWARFGDFYFIEDERYDHVRGRIVTEYTVINGDKTEKHVASHRCYTYRELCALLDAAGFTDVLSFGSASGEPFKLGSAGLFLVATKKKP